MSLVELMASSYIRAFLAAIGTTISVSLFYAVVQKMRPPRKDLDAAQKVFVQAAIDYANRTKYAEYMVINGIDDYYATKPGYDYQRDYFYAMCLPFAHDIILNSEKYSNGYFFELSEQVAAVILVHENCHSILGGRHGEKYAWGLTIQAWIDIGPKENFTGPDTIFYWKMKQGAEKYNIEWPQGL
jgi:hypothetical protein